MPYVSLGLSVLASGNMSYPQPCESSRNFIPFFWLFPWPLVVSSHEMYGVILSDRIWGLPEVLQFCLSLQPTPPFHSDLPNPVSLTSPKCDLYLRNLARWLDSVTANPCLLVGTSFFGSLISGIIVLCCLLSNVWKCYIYFVCCLVVQHRRFFATSS